MNTTRHLVAMALALGLTGLSAQAQTTVGQPGRLLASNCFQCHGTNGRGPGFDKLAGKSANEIYEELKEMQAKMLTGKEDEGLMGKHALGYTDAQLRAISTWFSQQRAR